MRGSVQGKHVSVYAMRTWERCKLDQWASIAFLARNAFKKLVQHENDTDNMNSFRRHGVCGLTGDEASSFSVPLKNQQRKT